jgi:sRNA-binding protein
MCRFYASEALNKIGESQSKAVHLTDEARIGKLLTLHHKREREAQKKAERKSQRDQKKAKRAQEREKKTAERKKRSDDEKPVADLLFLVSSLMRTRE